LGIANNTFVLGHVGRFVSAKNQEFLLHTLQHLLRRDPAYRLLLVGDGPRRVFVAREAHRLGVERQVVWAGNRKDVARLMLAAMDVFVFPSRYEGLGLVAIEAQAAGLPCVLSSEVPDEATVVDGLVHRLALSAGPSGWAEMITAMRGERALSSQASAWNTVGSSAFNLRTSVRRLEQLYLESLNQARRVAA
jgi:glycosyltransferase involved in cell wall biosynthesis